MKQLIYLDNAATTKTRPEVVEAMLPYFTEFYGNPSSVYEFSTESKKAVNHARETIARALGAKTNEIYFTAGGSESDNWALTATAEAYASKGKHIITSRIEHHAVLHTCQYLEKKAVSPGPCGDDKKCPHIQDPFFSDSDPDSPAHIFCFPSPHKGHPTSDILPSC